MIPTGLQNAEYYMDQGVRFCVDHINGDTMLMKSVLPYEEKREFTFDPNRSASEQLDEIRAYGNRKDKAPVTTDEGQIGDYCFHEVNYPYDFIDYKICPADGYVEEAYLILEDIGKRCGDNIAKKMEAEYINGDVIPPKKKRTGRNVVFTLLSLVIGIVCAIGVDVILKHVLGDSILVVFIAVLILAGFGAYKLFSEIGLIDD